MNKKFFKSVLSSLLALMLVVTCFAIPSSAAVTLSKSSVTVTKGYATTLTVSGTSSKVTWTTGDKAIATVSSAGKVSGKGVGSTYVYAQVNNTTLKCKVTVVAGKITAGVNDLDMTAGKSKIVNIICKGTHTITISNSDKNIAYGTWNGAKFDGDVVPLTIKAVSSGTAQIKVYAKNYPSVYAVIDVTVNGGAASITTQYSSVEVDVSKTASFKVFSTTKDALNIQTNSSQIATATITTPVLSGSTYYSTVTIKGVSAGNATIRVSSKTNSNSYVDIAVKVGGTAADYYAISTTIPSVKVSNDVILKFTYNYKTYYMLVPYNYDEAYTNTTISMYTNTYEYYTVYSMSPSKKAANDTINNIYTTSGVRYILLPSNYDTVKYNTVTAKYTGSYDYYTIYNESPAKKYSSDIIDRWTIVDSTNTTIARYMLYPINYDATRVSNIINEDRGTNSTYTTYTLLTAIPTKIGDDEQVVSLVVGTTTKYMVVSKRMTIIDFAKMNDAVSAATNKVSYYQWYTKLPSNIDTTKEDYLTVYSGSTYCYMLFRKSDSPSTYDTGSAAANSGTQLYDYR